MQERRVGIARADLRDLLAALHDLLLLDDDLAGMGVDGEIFIAVLDDEHLPKTTDARAHVRDFACSRCHDRIAHPAVDIDALAASLLESGDDLACGRSNELERIGICSSGWLRRRSRRLCRRLGRIEGPRLWTTRLDASNDDPLADRRSFRIVGPDAQHLPDSDARGVV